MKTINKLWVLIVILAMLAPLGVILPAYFKSGPAWGEWISIDRYGKSNIAYIASAILGISVIIAAIFLIGKMLGKKE